MNVFQGGIVVVKSTYFKEDEGDKYLLSVVEGNGDKAIVLVTLINLDTGNRWSKGVWINTTELRVEGMSLDKIRESFQIYKAEYKLAITRKAGKIS